MTAKRKAGERILKELDPDALQTMINALAPVAPDMPRLIAEFAFGEIYARPALDLRSRQLATVAALAALGAAGQLKAHLKSALRVGWSRDELVEVLMQMALYGGFPASLTALAVAKEAFAEIDSSAHGPSA